MASALEMVQQQYPYLAWLINDPEIGPLLNEAVDPNTGFDANTFQARLMGTSWFQSRSRYEREQLILHHTDPTTYWTGTQDFADQFSELSAKYGRPLSYNESYFLAVVAKNSGVDPNSATARKWLRGLINPQLTLGGYGTAGAAKNDIENLVRGQWFAPLDIGWLVQAGADVATGGGETLESINARLASQAWNWYPHLRQQITEGQTLADIINPYRQIVAEELEYGSLEDVDVTNNPEWKQLLEWRDPGTGEMRLPTRSEVQKLARNRAEWWETSAGRQADASGAAGLLRLFGARA